MKRSRFTDSQIITILKQAEVGTTVPELCREHGISSARFYKWLGCINPGFRGSDSREVPPLFFHISIAINNQKTVL